MKKKFSKELYDKRCGDTWRRWFKRLCQYRSKNPNDWPRKTMKLSSGHALGWWCSYQRQRFHRGRLLASQVKALEGIGFPWNSQYGRRRDGTTRERMGWDRAYKHLLAFCRKHPNEWPNDQIIVSKGFNLGTWFQRQRKAFRDNELSPKRIRLLRSIKFPFVGPHSTPRKGPRNTDQGKFAKNWDDTFQRLCQFRKQHPDKWPRIITEFPKGQPLGTWCSTQRKKRAHGTLSKKRTEALNAIHFPWEPNYTHSRPRVPRKTQKVSASWMIAYRKLLYFRRGQPTDWPHRGFLMWDGFPLGDWCYRQRRKHHQGRLSPKQYNFLVKINFPFQPKRRSLPSESEPFVTTPLQSWLTMFKRLRRYRLNYPNSWPTDLHPVAIKQKLASWCRSQQKLFEKDELSAQQVELLNELHFPWSIDDGEEWHRQLRYLKAFRKAFPRRWPVLTTRFPLANRLGRWCATQRSIYHNRKLPKLRLDALEAIHFPWEA